MSGGFSYASSEFNRASQALRQPGSAFKPFVYSTAFDNGYTPVSKVLDAPFEMYQGPGLPMWRPENYEHEFLGLATLRRGLELSRNLMTIRLAQAVGMDKIATTAEKFGVYDHLPRNLANSIGAYETTLLRMVTAYSEFDNGGKKIKPTLVDRVQDRNGKTIYRHDTRVCSDCNATWHHQQDPLIPDNRPQVMDPRTAYQTVSLMEGVVLRGTGRSVSVIGKPLAGKTGTSNDSKDVWFIGFSPDLVCGVFVGYDDPKTLGKHEQGATVAAPIFRDFMKEALADVPPIPFRVPPGIVFVPVDRYSGAEVAAGTPGSIEEAFRAGTEPGVAGLDDIASAPMNTQGQTTFGPATNVGEGTGGLY
jgi:penicillin-binding protein 1A